MSRIGRHGAIWGALWVLAVLCVFEGRAVGQSASDAEAKALFEEGKAAFKEADYRLALRAFRKSYDLSGRGELHYNIGLAADRLRLDDEALAAFEAYLTEVESPAREEEVRERIRALRLSIAERDELKRQTTRKRPKSAIIGSSVLAGVGIAGVIVMGVALARSGQCVQENSAGDCIRREQNNKGLTAFYGVVGFGALAGAGLWFGLSGRKGRAENRQAKLLLRPGGVTISGEF